MISEFNKECIPAWCENCEREGYVFLDDPEFSYFVICKGCGWETSYVWCSKCGMGGPFVENLSEHPSYWVCSGCKTKYQLPNEFYEKPINLYTEEELPVIVQEQIESDQKAAQLRSLKELARGLLLLVILAIVAMLPLALVLTPLPWTIPGFVMTILVFAGWWWLISRVVKIIRKEFPRQSS